MESTFVLTAIGKDKPGLVESLAAVVASHGGNWLESHLGRLGGQFAGVVRISLPENRVKDLETALRGLQSKGLKVEAQPDVEAAKTDGTEAELTLIGQDRPGMVRQISEALARHGINVEELETECRSAPMSGENLFHARARVFVPKDCSTAELDNEFEKIAADLMAEIKLNPVQKV